MCVVVGSTACLIVNPRLGVVRERDVPCVGIICSCRRSGSRCDYDVIVERRGLAVGVPIGTGVNWVWMRRELLSADMSSVPECDATVYNSRFATIICVDADIGLDSRNRLNCAVCSAC